MKPPVLQAICFVRPTRENVTLLKRELRQPRYQSYHLCEHLQLQQHSSNTRRVGFSCSCRSCFLGGLGKQHRQMQPAAEYSSMLVLSGFYAMQQCMAL